MHNVATITNGLNYQTRLAISATGGGAIDLSGTTSIVDPDAGTSVFATIDVTADGTGSTIDLSALASFIDNYAGSTTAENRFSTLTASNSGLIALAAGGQFAAGRSVGHGDDLGHRFRATCIWAAACWRAMAP